MKKLLIPIAVLIFLMNTTPAFAAAKYGWSFSFGPFHFGDPPEPVIGEDDIVPILPSPFVDEKGMKYPTGRPIRFLSVSPRPTKFENPSNTPKPTKSVRDKINNEGRGTTGPKGSSGENRANGFGATGNVGSEAAKNRNKEALKSSVTKMYENFQQRLDQYKEFIAKLKSRRDKFTQMGKDVTALSAEIADAEGALIVGQNVLNKALAIVEKLDYAGDLQVVRKEVLNQNRTVRDALTNLYNISRHTTDLVKDVSIEPSHSPKPSRMPSIRQLQETKKKI